MTISISTGQIELLQLLAIVFVVSDKLPMMGASTLNKVSNYLLLNFASFDIKMWITLFLVRSLVSLLQCPSDL